MATLLYRVGTFSFRRRWVVLIVWLAVLGALVSAALVSGLHLKDSFSIPGTESDRAQSLLVERLGTAAAGAGGDSRMSSGPKATTSSARVVVGAPDGASLLDGGLADVMTTLAPLAAQPGVVALSDPAKSQAVAPDGSVAYVDVQFSVAADHVAKATQDAVLAAQSSLEAKGMTVAVTGGPFDPKLELIGPTEAVGVVVALVLLIITFGSLLAAGMPMVTALWGVGIGATGVLAVSSIIDVSSATLALALMLGLAVGIDYALFLLSRHRQQLADGMTPLESTGRAVGTAGSAVVFAGMTVVIALAALSVAGIPFITAMGLAAAGTVAVAVLIAVTLLPALFGFAGDRLLPRGRAAVRAERFVRTENHWAGLVTRRPVVALIASTIVLGVIALPALGLRLGLPDAGQEKLGSSSRVAYDLLADGFGPGFNGPLVVLVDAAKNPSALAAAVGTVAERVGALPDVAHVAVPGADAAGAAATAAASAAGQTPQAGLVVVIPSSGPNSAETASLVHAIRGLRAQIETQTGTELWVTGAAAANIDITQKLADVLPLFLVIVVGLALVLLMIAFRSILVPVTAALGFLLAVAAAFGATTAVFQWGWLADFFHVAAPAPLLSFMPILLVGVLFGLAMDYQVFLVSRMREEHVHGADPLTAVRVGYAHGSRVVLAAALIMIAVFSSFVFSGDTAIGPIAFAMGIGIAFDALVVRMTMVPAVMALLGRSAWWLPRWLDRILPRVDIEGESLSRRDAEARNI